MTPTLALLTQELREILTAQHATAAQVENARRLALTVIGGNDSATVVRQALLDALDTDARPDARSFATDSGVAGASRRR